GRGDVTESNRLWTFSGGSNVTSPVVAGDHLFWVSDSGTAYCLELKEGKKVYSERLSGAGRVYGSALAADGKLYVPSREKGVYVLGATPKFEQLAHNSFKDDRSIFNASPVPSNGQLLIRSDQYLYCVGKK